MMQAVADGMATAEETFPLPQAVEKPAEASTPAQQSDSAAAGDSETKPEPGDGQKLDNASPGETKPERQSKTAKAETKAEQPKDAEQYLELVRATATASTGADALRAWFASDAQRKLRTTIGVIHDDMNTARQIIEARVAELRK